MAIDNPGIVRIDDTRMIARIGTIVLIAMNTVLAKIDITKDLEKSHAMIAPLEMITDLLVTLSVPVMTDAKGVASLTTHTLLTKHLVNTLQTNPGPQWTTHPKSRGERGIADGRI